MDWHSKQPFLGLKSDRVPRDPLWYESEFGYAQGINGQTDTLRCRPSLDASIAEAKANAVKYLKNMESLHVPEPLPT